MATPITLQQMLARPMVLGAFSRVSTAPAYLQQFFRMNPTSPATISGGLNRTFAYDIYGHSLTMAQARPPKIGPAKIAPKPIGTAMATIMRFYEAIPFYYGDVYGLRGLGTMEIDQRGEAYVARQKLYMAERQVNALEFMISRMFRGGFSITVTNESFILGEKGAGTVDVDYNLPANNSGNLNGIIDANWDLAGTKIINQLLNLNAEAELQTGFPIRHIFINSKTYGYLLANTQMQTVRGTALPIFNNYRTRFIQTAAGPQRESGFDVQFPSIPNITFHVYDGASVVSSQTDPATRTSVNTSKYIPDGRALLVPEPDPGGWHGLATCGEPIKETDDAQPEIKEGLNSWSYGINDPPGEELRVLNNLLPVLFVPAAPFWATIY